MRQKLNKETDNAFFCYTTKMYVYNRSKHVDLY